MTSPVTLCYAPAVIGMARSAPKNLLKRAELEASDAGVSAGAVSLVELELHLLASDPNDTLRQQLHLAVAQWDSTTEATWATGTKSRTLERRVVVEVALGLDDRTAAVFRQLFPVTLEGSTVISDTFDAWYRKDGTREQGFYYGAYSNYLQNEQGWPSESMTNLDEATSQVVERLSDPTRPDSYQAKGLVVGYVQSGKTANFTGVIAKTIDAGYRLVIVLTGTLDLLREQTQRRLDMELVGRENILRGINPDDPDSAENVDYLDDPDWLAGKFLTHGDLPSNMGAADIVRLTTHHFDYKSLKQGITAIEFEKEIRSKPFFDPVNLQGSKTRLVVVKKNKAVLTKLVKDLKSIAGRLHEIPAIIIDDESDQASVNTTDPKKSTNGQVERTAINKLISQLLAMLPRCQYIGYTATPFANVFIDPSDSEDVFPKDFLVSLDRPPGYMGVSDFHDLESEIDVSDRNFGNSNESAHVRSLRGQGADRNRELASAIDAYVLSGAIKLFRSSLGAVKPFKHHTMLVHETVKQIDHSELANTIEALWMANSYTTSQGLEKLRFLYDTDFCLVSAARPDGPMPQTFDELKSFVGAAAAKIAESGSPVIVVNGDKDIEQEKLDFDQRPIWRILVGGTKLSRGFTVEGLTVSYYRRKTKQADTVMQMGRWFGFRNGYRDLVRLYIGREEPDQKGTVDLYEAFEAVVRDEEHFRSQLKQYAGIVDGRPLLTPAQIPPLVAQHLPWVKPTARNKMFNAELKIRRSPGTPVSPIAYPNDKEGLAWNYEHLLPLFAAANDRRTLVAPAAAGRSRTTFEALIGTVSTEVFLSALTKLRWVSEHYFAPDLRYFEELRNQVDDWVVIAPQLGTRGTIAVLPEVGARSVMSRNRSRGDTFQNFSDPKHRPIAQRIAQAITSYSDPVAESLVQQRRGAVVLYPVVETDKTQLTQGCQLSAGEIVMGFVAVSPASATSSGSRLIEFVTKNKSLNAAVVPAT
jgi:Z1 domain